MLATVLLAAAAAAEAKARPNIQFFLTVRPTSDHRLTPLVDCLYAPTYLLNSLRDLRYLHSNMLALRHSRPPFSAASAIPPPRTAGELVVGWVGRGGSFFWKLQ